MLQKMEIAAYQIDHHFIFAGEDASIGRGKNPEKGIRFEDMNDHIHHDKDIVKFVQSGGSAAVERAK